MNSFTSNSDLEGAGGAHLGLRRFLPLIILLTLVGFVESLAFSCRGLADSTRSFVPAGQLPKLAETIVQAKIEFATKKADKIDLVVLGDSSGLMGVNAHLLERLTGKPTYNLSTIGWLGIEGHLVLLADFIETHSKPSVVVYHFAPDTMRRQRSSFDKFGYLSRLRWTLDSGESQHCNVLPSFGFRSITRGFVAPGFSEVARGRWPSHSDTLRLLVSNKGSLPEVNKSEWRRVPQLLGGFSNSQQLAMRRLVEAAQAFDFQLCLIANPIPEIGRTPANLLAMAHLEIAISEVIEHSDSVKLHRPLGRFMSNESCVSLNHLHPNAVDWNTMAIAEFVRPFFPECVP